MHGQVVHFHWNSIADFSLGGKSVRHQIFVSMIRACVELKCRLLNAKFITFFNCVCEYILCVLVLWVNMIFVVFILRVCIHTGQAEKFAHLIAYCNMLICAI